MVAPASPRDFYASHDWEFVAVAHKYIEKIILFDCILLGAALTAHLLLTFASSKVADNQFGNILFNVGIHSVQTDKRAFSTVTKGYIHLKYNKSKISLFFPAGCNRLYPKPRRGKNLLSPLTRQSVELFSFCNPVEGDIYSSSVDVTQESLKNI